MLKSVTWSKLLQSCSLEECVDSLLFDNGTVLASVESDTGIRVSIMVFGEIRLWYKGKLYCRAAAFPEELIDAIKHATNYSEIKDFSIADGTWFEVRVWNRDEYIDSDIWESAISEKTPADLREELIDYVTTSHPELFEEKDTMMTTTKTFVVTCNDDYDKSSVTTYKSDDKNDRKRFAILSSVIEDIKTPTTISDEEDDVVDLYKAIDNLRTALDNAGY